MNYYIDEKRRIRNTYANELHELADIDENDNRRTYLEDRIEELDNQIRILLEDLYN